jgi:hypothetical protein
MGYLGFERQVLPGGRDAESPKTTRQEVFVPFSVFSRRHPEHAKVVERRERPSNGWVSGGTAFMKEKIPGNIRDLMTRPVSGRKLPSIIFSVVE